MCGKKEDTKNMNVFFTAALDLREHPIKKAKRKIRIDYFVALTYIIEKTISSELNYQNEIKKIGVDRSRLYKTQLFSDISLATIDEKKGVDCLNALSKPWLNEFQFMLVCDAALILLEETIWIRASKMIKEKLTVKSLTDIDQVILLLQTKKKIEKRFLSIASLIKQYRINKDFFAKEERRIIVTANTSAGKSTLINALIGKPITRTSQEVCTGNICYLFNKAYEDGNVCLSTKQDLNLKASEDDLRSYDWNGSVSFATYFASVMKMRSRVCIIDTPGVDAALHKEHSNRTYDALINGSYDMVIYVVCPTRLGTDAEKKHLQWVAQNLQKDKIVFVLNKLDDYHDFSDSIEESIHKFEDDLKKIGIKSPVICPISAYFSYLIKLKITGHDLSEDEEDEYEVYSKKFKKAAYDLSHYYEEVRHLPVDREEIVLSKCAGLYGLEKIIYGGKG